MGIATPKVVDYDTYVQERILNGALSFDTTYYVVVDLIKELEDEEFKAALTKRLNIAIEKLPMPVELLIHYITRDRFVAVGKYYTHDGTSHTLGDLILIAGKFKQELFSIYRQIMKKKNTKFTLYETVISSVGIHA